MSATTMLRAGRAARNVRKRRPSPSSPGSEKEPPLLARIRTTTTLEHLQTVGITVDPECVGQHIYHRLQEDPQQPGILIVKAHHLSGMISRRRFFEMLGRPFGPEVYLRRPIREMLKADRHCPLVLASASPVQQAARQALERSGEMAFEPIVVDHGDGRYGILQVHKLLMAQNRLLELSTAKIEEQLAAAKEYVISLLPEPISEGPVRAA